MARTRKQLAVYHAIQRRKLMQDVFDFRFLLDTPEDLGNVAAGGSSTTVALPANARLALALDDVTVEGDLGLNDGVDDVYGAGGVADFVQRLNTTPESREVAILRSLGCPAGAASLYILDEWQRPYLIATATFT